MRLSITNSRHFLNLFQFVSNVFSTSFNFFSTFFNSFSQKFAGSTLKSTVSQLLSLKVEAKLSECWVNVEWLLSHCWDTVEADFSSRNLLGTEPFPNNSTFSFDKVCVRGYFTEKQKNFAHVGFEAERDNQFFGSWAKNLNFKNAILSETSNLQKISTHPQKNYFCLNTPNFEEKMKKNSFPFEIRKNNSWEKWLWKLSFWK